MRYWPYRIGRSNSLVNSVPLFYHGVGLEVEVMVRCTLPRKYFGIDFTYGGSFAIRYSGDFTADEIYMTLSFLASQSPEAFVDA